MNKNMLALAAIGLASALSVGCGQKDGADKALKDALAAGEYSRAEVMLDSIIASAQGDMDRAYAYIQKKDSLYKLRSDFRRTKDEMISYIGRYYGDSTLAKVNGWIADGTLEYRVIDGDTLFFRNAAPQCVPGG